MALNMLKLEYKSYWTKYSNNNQPERPPPEDKLFPSTSSSSIEPESDVEDDDDDQDDQPKLMDINKLPSELRRFLLHPRIPSSVNTLSWWAVNSVTFPLISKIARDYLGAQGATTFLETSFSDLNDIITPNTASLSDSSVTIKFVTKYYMNYINNRK
ncbi:hypothetical protein SAMD00019534_046860 [Acytostelium subglobosum LB1]|uniref:hypothetical protein n=1 Tax=Acytostelium subglobosum LB1 TaxID=1410327 RepID=UPI000644E4D3|nr:hypothetical protein SAMD00019534_046860 [Acytostelium subglobosum LB1]GAM21511.1 hypothetical protein SAMD00019534_046860 [Acytostelium subglobosum LB1]|eukprot:XP_012755630.1 hypothetical protein SAMD00019534_046860 [Acytostelium subglobosum LB1]